MSTTEHELVLELLALSRPGPGATIAQRRAQYERAAVAFAGEAESTARSEPIGAARGEWSRRAGPRDPVLLYLHGGSYVFGSAASHRHLACAIGVELGASVLTLDYRRAPESPFPAGVDDAVAAYQMLAGQGVPAERIAVAGDSAGAGLALALLQRLRAGARPLPAAVACLSPWTDLGCASPTHTTHAARDPVLRTDDLRAMAALYLGGVPADEPLASAAFADLTGLPPMLVQVGSEEILLDDARRLVQRALADGVPVECQEWEGMFHVWQYYYPVLSQGRSAIKAIGRFMREALRAARRPASVPRGASAPARVVTDPRTAPHWWPKQADDPRDGLPWAAGVSDPVSFLGLADGPALWLRDPAGNSGRMDPVAVISGAVAGLEADSREVQAAAGAYPRILVSSATGYGSPVTLAGAAADDDVAALAAALTGHARDSGVTPVVLQCPGGNPLLAALTGQGFSVGVTDLYPTLELPGESIEDYLGDLPRGRRASVRQEIRARERGSAHVYVGEQARQHLVTAARLSASAYRQRNQPADDARAIPIYSRLLDRCGDDFVLTMVCDENGPVASACLIAGDTDLLLYSAGLEHPRSRAVAGYFNASYYLPAEFAYQRGLRRILLGPTGWHTKRLRGARFTPLYSAVPPGADALANLLAQTDRRLRPALEQASE